ncbi:MAG: serine/threonine-protein kinase [Eubacteriales bacterium]|nr:serine/threonine-protein kinase [Eubacteriales bacterium]
MKIENLCIKCMKEKSSPEAVCEHCGFDPAAASVPPHHLPPFVILAGKYLVGTAIGEGGFGITYIGIDLNLEMRVAIKEYYPNGCAVRDMSGNSSTVQSYSGEQQGFFEAGREKFINEAKILAKCMHLPEIVTVKDFFKENHTAYIVMEYVDGKTLKDYLKEKGGRLSAEETLHMLGPVIRSLGEVHKMNLIHRDISPDNIMVQKNGSVKVLDFGGARDFGSAGRSMSIMLKPGYAPEEQYRTHGEQGPWTDVYAICATMYRCITGEIPPEAMERSYQDKIKPFSAFQVNCPANVEAAVLKGLSVYKNGRFQSMEELYKALYQKQGNTPHAAQNGNNIGTGGGRQPAVPTDYGRDTGNDDSLNKNLKMAAMILGCIMILMVVAAVVVCL